MKNVLFIAIFICIFSISKGQVKVSGKLIDHEGNFLVDVKVTFYTEAGSYCVLSDSTGIFSIELPDMASLTMKIPVDYSISESYPNPFNKSTRINVVMPVENDVILQVFDINGRMVTGTQHKHCVSGNNYYDVVLDGLSNGLYFAKFTIKDNYSAVRKLILNNDIPGQTVSDFIYDLTNPDINFFKSAQVNNVDSIVVTSEIIGKKVFYNAPPIQGDSINLGELVIERYCKGIPTVEYEGKIYNTVQIGCQCWLKENLNVGQMINVLGNQENNNVIEKYCFDDDEGYNCYTYGGLYQWPEAVQYKNGASMETSPVPSFSSEPVQGICPSGWHIPSQREFVILSETVGHDGNALKAVGQGKEEGIGNNKSGFSALLAGPRGQENYGYEGNQTDFWTSTYSGSNNAFLVTLVPTTGTFFLTTVRGKQYGFSIRCIKD